MLMKERFPCPRVALLALMVKKSLPTESSSSQVAGEKLPPSKGHLSHRVNAPRTTIEAGVGHVDWIGIDLMGKEKTTL